MRLVMLPKTRYNEYGAFTYAVMVTEMPGIVKGGEPVSENNCVRLRKKRGFSQQQLSIIAGMSPATIVAIEKYGYVPGPWVRKKLARALQSSEARIWPGLSKEGEAGKQTR